jgi:hypothetical protein
MKTKQITVEGLWREYRDACYPPKNGQLDTLQETETRQAFYAGMLITAKTLVESSVYMTEEQAARNIGTLIDEAQRVCRERIYEMKGRN